MNLVKTIKKIRTCESDIAAQLIMEKKIKDTTSILLDKVIEDIKSYESKWTESGLIQTMDCEDIINKIKSSL